MTSLPSSDRDRPGYDQITYFGFFFLVAQHSRERDLTRIKELTLRWTVCDSTARNTPFSVRYCTLIHTRRLTDRRESCPSGKWTDQLEFCSVCRTSTMRTILKIQESTCLLFFLKLLTRLNVLFLCKEKEGGVPTPDGADHRLHLSRPTTSKQQEFRRHGHKGWFLSGTEKSCCSNPGSNLRS